MSLRGSNDERTLCEVLREINDIMQGEPKHKEVLEKLREAESMAKKMAYKLLDYNKEVFKEWWDKNPEYEKTLKLRMSEKYIA